MIDRGGNGERIGRRLLSLSNRLFRHWHKVRDGTLSWSAFQERMLRLRREVKRTLLEGSNYLTSCFEADRRGHALPSLLPATRTRSKAT
jgi:hypothetical protein